MYFLRVDLLPGGPGALHPEGQVYIDGAFVDFSRLFGQFCHHRIQLFNVLQKGHQKFMSILQTEKCTEDKIRTKKTQDKPSN